MPAATGLRVHRLDQLQQRLPRHHPFHLGQENLSSRTLALARVLRIAKSELCHATIVRDAQLKRKLHAGCGLDQSFPSG